MDTERKFPIVSKIQGFEEGSDNLFKDLEVVLDEHYFNLLFVMFLSLSFMF